MSKILAELFPNPKSQENMTKMNKSQKRIRIHISLKLKGIFGKVIVLIHYWFTTRMESQNTNRVMWCIPFTTVRTTTKNTLGNQTTIPLETLSMSLDQVQFSKV